jgi:hypothetical protein
MERKRTQQHGVDDGENGSVGADTQCEDEDGSYSKAGRFEEHSNSIANVLTDCLHNHLAI